MADKTFKEIFEELSRHNDRSIIWNDFLDYAIEVNLLNYNKEFQRNYHGNEEQYAELMAAWLQELAQKLEKYPYYDILGEFYEELVTSKVKSSTMGQFFSPVGVSNLINNIVYPDIEANDKMGKTAYDPACGSARMLLEAHVQSQGDLFCIGEELDGTAARMAVLNFFSHGVRGSVLQMDTLERQWFDGWRINRYLYHGVPVPHIERINNESEAYNFIELNNQKLSNAKQDNTDNDNDDNDEDLTVSDNDSNTIVDSTTIKNSEVQSTLI